MVCINVSRVMYHKVNTQFLIIPPVCCSFQQDSLHLLALVIFCTAAARVVGNLPLMTSEGLQSYHILRKETHTIDSLDDLGYFKKLFYSVVQYSLQKDYNAHCPSHFNNNINCSSELSKCS